MSGRRESSVLWSRTLPGFWHETRAKFLFRRMKRPPPEDSGVVTAFRDGEVTLRENRRVDGFTFATKEIGYQGVNVGDLVIHSMDGFAGAIGVSDSDGKCSPVYLCCVPLEGSSPRFYAYVLRHMALSDFITSLARGIRERSTSFGWNDFAEQLLPHPPPATQRAIADFLDRKTAAIDALIEKKERLLALLAEKRAALIHRAVTKGLDPSVPMKDSGVPWIGKVPEHWEVSRVKFVVSHTVDCHHSTPEYEAEEAYPALRTTDVRTGWLDLNGARRVGEQEYRHRISRLKPAEGDIVFTREGDWGRAAPVPEHVQLCLAQRVMLFRANERTDGEFLMWTMNSAATYGQLAQHVVSTTAPHVNISDIREVLLALPTHTEQREIAAWVSKAMRRVREHESSLLRSLALVREYRQALITAAVTGQLDLDAGEDEEAKLLAAEPRAKGYGAPS